MDPVFVYNVAKAALGAVQHFTTAETSILSIADCPPEKLLESLRIYPNPAFDFINIEMLNSNFRDYSFNITDLSGKLLLKTKNSKEIDISKLSPGIYFGTMKVEDRKLTKKIIISK